jgi:hypothetical protein
LKVQAERRLAQSQRVSLSSGYSTRLGTWVFALFQRFFDSDEQSLITRYQEIARHRQESIFVLKCYRAGLAATELKPVLDDNTVESSVLPIMPVEGRTMKIQATPAPGAVPIPRDRIPSRPLDQALAQHILIAVGAVIGTGVIILLCVCLGPRCLQRCRQSTATTTRSRPTESVAVIELHIQSSIETKIPASHLMRDVEVKLAIKRHRKGKTTKSRTFCSVNVWRSSNNKWLCVFKFQ